jgi:adenosylcobinamide-GDP ribazoletransferase
VRRSAGRDGLLLAVGTFTVLRVPSPRVVDRAAAGVAMALAPLAGLLVAVPAAGVVALFRWLGAGDLVAAVLGVAVLAWGTGGLHLDGLADTVDGVAASRGDPARALEVMRRGDVGPLGAVAVGLVLLLQASALARALPIWGPTALVVGAASGRAVLAVLCARGVPAARPGGLGATVAGSVPRLVAVLVPVVVLAAASAVAPMPWRGGVAVLAGCAGGLLLAGRAARRLRGITGDVLGAAVEAGTATALVALCLHTGA